MRICIFISSAIKYIYIYIYIYINDTAMITQFFLQLKAQFEGVICQAHFEVHKGTAIVLWIFWLFEHCVLCA